MLRRRAADVPVNRSLAIHAFTAGNGGAYLVRVSSEAKGDGMPGCVTSSARIDYFARGSLGGVTIGTWSSAATLWSPNHNLRATGNALYVLGVDSLAVIETR